MLLAPLVAAQTASPGFLSSLGIDWRSLFLDALAFLVIAWLTERFIYPVLSRALDAKRNELAAAERLKREAAESLRAAQESGVEILSRAHQTALDTVKAAHQEAAELVRTAKTEASSEASRIAKEAEDRLAQEARAARRALKQETIGLVAFAAGVVLDEKLTSQRDTELITSSLEREQ